MNKMQIERKIKKLIRAATDGDIYSQMLLGAAYCEGDGVEKNLREGLQWLSLAEHAGELQAGYVAALFQVKNKDATAIQKLAELAAKGYFPASYELGNCFYYGWLVERNEATAVTYWQNAANHDHIISKLKLAALKVNRGDALRKVALLPNYLALIIRFALISITNSRDLRIKGTFS